MASVCTNYQGEKKEQCLSLTQTRRVLDENCDKTLVNNLLELELF